MIVRGNSDEVDSKKFEICLPTDLSLFNSYNTQKLTDLPFQTARIERWSAILGPIMRRENVERVPSSRSCCPLGKVVGRVCKYGELVEDALYRLRYPQPWIRRFFG